MLLVSLVLALPHANAGYGDVDGDGHPSWADRDVHLWTNAARVDPEAFEDDYQSGGCSYYEDFSEDEQTPQAPLYYSRELNEAAVYHSEDMEESGEFSHDSSDGTSFGERVARYYTETGTIGENIAFGYGSGYNSVFVGWMCSESGHRANIMGSSYTELGTGVSGSYYTQDFAAGTADSEGPVAMGVHSPQDPTGEVTFYADWVDDAAPARLEVVVDGQATSLDLEWGDETQGIFASAQSWSNDGECHEYFYSWATEAGLEGSFPETGSFLIGSCDAEYDWVDGQMGVSGRDDAEVEELVGRLKLVGCATAPGAAGAGWALGLIALARRRAAPYRPSR